MPGACYLLDDMKVYAEAYARSTRPAGLDFKGRQWLLTQMYRQLASERVPADAFTYYAGELTLMIRKHRRDRPRGAHCPLKRPLPT